MADTTEARQLADELSADVAVLIRECRHRTHKLFGWWRPSEKATRATAPADAA